MYMLTLGIEKVSGPASMARRIDSVVPTDCACGSSSPPDSSHTLADR